MNDRYEAQMEWVDIISWNGLLVKDLNHTFHLSSTMYKKPFCRHIQQQGICAVFKSDNTLRSHLVQLKDTVNPTK